MFIRFFTYPECNNFIHNTHISVSYTHLDVYKRQTSYTELMAKSPQRAVEKAIRGMLPKNSLARQQLSKLKVYAGAEHPHQAQKPVPFEISQVAQ